MRLKYVLTGYASVMIGAIIELWVGVYISGLELGINPLLIKSGLSPLLFSLGILLLCRGMQVDMKEATSISAFTDEMVVSQVDG